MINLVIIRGLKKIGYGRYLNISRYRARKGLAPATSAEGPLTDGYDWSYLDGTPGTLNKGQSLRYLRDQEFGRTMVDFTKDISESRKRNSLSSAGESDISEIKSPRKF